MAGYRQYRAPSRGVASPLPPTYGLQQKQFIKELVNMIPLSRSPIATSVVVLLMHIVLVIFCWYAYLAMREEMTDFHSEVSSVLVEGYSRYYEKWPDKRLEGAHQFLKMSSEPTVELLILNQAFLLILVLIAVNATSSIYYEFRLASLRRKLDSLQDSYD